MELFLSWEVGQKSQNLAYSSEVSTSSREIKPLLEITCLCVEILLHLFNILSHLGDSINLDKIK